MILKWKSVPEGHDALIKEEDCVISEALRGPRGWDW